MDTIVNMYGNGECCIRVILAFYIFLDMVQKENLPGGGTLHSMMTPHGPDNKTFVHTSQMELKPVKMEGTMVCHVSKSFSSSTCNCARYGTWSVFCSVVDCLFIRIVKNVQSLHVGRSSNYYH